MKKIVYMLIFAAFFLPFSGRALAVNSRAATKDSIGIVNKVAQIKDSASEAHSNIKDELSHADLKQILAGITNLKEGKIAKMINLFSGKNMDWKWIIKEGVLPENINANTTVTKEGAITTLDYNKLEKATSLSVARTIIHEMVHAYLTLYYSNDPIGASNDFPFIILAWESTPTPNYNDIQHAQMEQSLVADMALALKEYGQSIGLSVNDSIYSDLAWGGLDFENSSRLSQSDKLRIQLRLSAEQLNISFLNVSPAGPKIG